MQKLLTFFSRKSNTILYEPEDIRVSRARTTSSIRVFAKRSKQPLESLQTPDLGQETVVVGF